MFKEFKVSMVLFVTLVMVSSVTIGANSNSSFDAMWGSWLCSTIIAVPFGYYWVKNTKEDDVK